MVKVVVNGLEIDVEQDTTVLHACEQAGFEIPRFCYHEKLEIAGNCRMCLVEVEKAPKLVASCSQNVTAGMVIHTNNERVQKAREGVMEFLLINHPLDCPICDQGGECDLQDQAIKYGRNISRYEDAKRAVVKKYMGPLIETNMTRCIHCTRCVRFLKDVAGTNELGAIGRGEHMEITTYVEQSIASELSGNIIDLCPVGALTSKPHRFQFRAWELRTTPSIAVLDAVGANIVIQTRGMELMRVLPQRNDDINEEWICDKTRFAHDALKMQRLETPMVKMNGKFENARWSDAFAKIRDAITDINVNEVGAVAGKMADMESMFVMKKFLDMLGSDHYDCRENGSFLTAEDRWFYTFGTTIKNIEKADLFLIIGGNPRKEAPIINARIRKAILNNKAEVALLGEKIDLTYNYQHLGAAPSILQEIAEYKNDFALKLQNAQRPVIIVSEDVFKRDDHQAFKYYLHKICQEFSIIRDEWNGFNMLHHSASRVGGLDLGFIYSNGNISDVIKKSKVLFLLGADDFDLSLIPASTFVVYQGSHGDNSINRADVVLPSAAYTEKNGIYVNTEGRAQRAFAATVPVGDAKIDWQIIDELAQFLGIDIKLHSLQEIRSCLEKHFPHVYAMDNIVQVDEINFHLGNPRKFLKTPLKQSIANFYMTDAISRNSKTMAECTLHIQNSSNNALLS